MEGLAAERAARLGSDTDLAVISATFARMEAAQDSNSAEDDAVLDAQFHMSIIEASHNVVMLHMMRSMYDLLRSGVFYNRQMMFKQQTNRSELLNQHRAIVDALLIRDAGGARAAVEAHLNYVERALLDQQRAERHENVAQQRLDHEMRG
jgi:GntR family transcriptional repressor for pyruvate dehydrogenase complex